jgi:hypothetical protein
VCHALFIVGLLCCPTLKTFNSRSPGTKVEIYVHKFYAFLVLKFHRKCPQEQCISNTEVMHEAAGHRFYAFLKSCRKYMISSMTWHDSLIP